MDFVESYVYYEFVKLYFSEITHTHIQASTRRTSLRFSKPPKRPLSLILVKLVRLIRIVQEGLLLLPGEFVYPK